MATRKSGDDDELTLEQTPIMESSRNGEEFTSRFRPQAAPSKAPTRGNVSRFSFGLARHTLGMGLLLVVVVLWTSSNFLASVCIQKITAN